MLGFNHVASGVAAGLVGMPWAPMHGVVGHTGWVLGVGGAALVCDLDAPGSSAARMWGPVTERMARWVGHASRGHRWGTHDAILAPLAWVLLTLVCQLAPILVECQLALLIGLALQGLRVSGLHRIGPLINLAASAMGAHWIWQHQHPGARVLALMGAAGIWVHIAGDSITTAMVPIPIVWIGRRRRFGLPLFEVGHRIERLLIAPLLSLSVIAAWCWRTHIHTRAQLLALLNHTVTSLHLP